jgi:hypothetical protein
MADLEGSCQSESQNLGRIPLAVQQARHKNTPMSIACAALVCRAKRPCGWSITHRS